MANGDTKTNQYLDIAANGTRADLPSDTCCETRTQTLIRGVAERIITEEETRAAADRTLQGEIDEIKNSPDVFDIVATKADLDAYDTSTITDKDIIRVLRDEDHNNASTYYRWDASNSEFDYIGEVGDYYTKAQADALLATKADRATTYTKTEVDTALSGKQDVLIAGANIQINGDTISATDTTYSDFIGTDGTAAGETGLVPAPATTDAGKFLKADGTWDTAGPNINVVQTTGTSTADVMSQNAVTNALASAGPTVVQATGTSTTNVMSQNATTSMVYADPSTKKRIQIGNNTKAGDRANFNSVAIGDGAKAYTGNDVVIGNNAQTSKSGASTVGGGNVAIGRSAAVSKTNTLPEGGIAIGDTAVSDASFTTAIGAHTNAQGVGSIALGSYATTTSAQRGVMNIGTTVTNWGYSSSNYRLLTGLYDPQGDHDAATKGYVDNNIPATFTTNEWDALWA